MENTEKLQFKDDAPRWFVAIGESWIGPLFASEVYKKIVGQELTWAHYIWTPGQSGWQRISDTEAFEASVPQKPSRQLLTELKGASTPAPRKKTGTKTGTGSRSFSGARMLRAQRTPDKVEPKVWFLYFNDSQFGPFSRDEIRRFLKVGKINDRVHAWKDGMSDWERIHSLPELKNSSGKTAPRLSKAELPDKDSTRIKKKEDQRGSPRKPMVARILMANQSGVIAAVCRDISVGGMQVLTDQVPGEAGTHLKLNVSPTGPGAPRPFAAEGVIVRVLEDGLGFSFRFENLNQEAHEAIERYLSEGEA